MAKSDDAQVHIVVRRGTRSDVPTIKNMIQELAEIANLRNDEPQLSEENLLKDAFEASPPWFFILMADIGEETVGFAMYNRAYFSRTGRAIYLECLYVRRRWRRCGVSRRLMQEICKEAVAAGACGIRGVVRENNGEARKIYTSLGAVDQQAAKGLICYEFQQPHLQRLAKDCNYFVCSE